MCGHGIDFSWEGGCEPVVALVATCGGGILTGLMCHLCGSLTSMCGTDTPFCQYHTTSWVRMVTRLGRSRERRSSAELPALVVSPWAAGDTRD